MSSEGARRKDAPATIPAHLKERLTMVASVDELKIDMKYLIRALLKYNASDLHIKVGRPPLYRINGHLIPAKMPELSSEQASAIIYGTLNERQARELEERRQIDFSFKVRDYGRFRCNVYFTKGQISAAVRMIPFQIPKLSDLGLPSVLKDLCTRPRGLILVTGATGSGKSTSLAAMVRYINENRHSHVLTIEDPIEFVHNDIKSCITQREVGSDCLNVNDALRAGLRQDPDVIMIGEMRDMEMIQAALTAAETGHLVLSTLHTNDCKSSIDRIVDVFPAEAKNQVRIQLANSLVGVVSQQLIVRADGHGRIPAVEVMVKSPAIEDYILRNELEKIPQAIATSSNYYRMQSMNQALYKLCGTGRITVEEALRSSFNPDDLKLLISGVNRESGYQTESSSSVERDLE